MPGAATRVGVERALRYIKAGRAAMEGTGLRFLEDHHANQSAAANGRHTCGGYDRVNRLMTVQELSGLPLVDPWAMLAPVGKLVQRPKRMSAAVVNKAYTCAREIQPTSA